MSRKTIFPNLSIEVETFGYGAGDDYLYALVESVNHLLLHLNGAVYLTRSLIQVSHNRLLLSNRRY